jgi:hypothetical protein
MVWGLPFKDSHITKQCVDLKKWLYLRILFEIPQI